MVIIYEKIASDNILEYYYIYNTRGNICYNTFTTLVITR